MIGAITNEGKPIKITTNKLIKISIHFPLLYPATTPRIVPKSTEITNEGIVIHIVHDKGLKKKSGILSNPLSVA